LTQAVLLGGLFIGVLSALPFINVANCCCLWMIGGGAIAVYLAQQDDPRPLGLLDGARIGLRAGLVGAAIWLLTSLAVDQMIAPLQQRAADAMLRNAADMPVDVRAWLESTGDRASAPLRFVLGFFFQVFVAAPFAALGGIFGAATFGGAIPPIQEEP
jgi:small basic protein